MSNAAASILEISVVGERFPPYDPAHATPDPMVRRTLTIRTLEAFARFEQTDYGHAGRFNPWEPRGIDAALQPRTSELRAICDVLTPLLR